MPKYLYEYVDAEGRRAHAFIHAGSATEACRQLAERSQDSRCRNAVLIDDDLMAQLRDRRPDTPHLKPSTLARVEVIARQGSSRWPLFLVSLRDNVWMLLGGTALAVYGAVTGGMWILAAGAAVPIFHVLAFWLSSRHLETYNRLLRAGALGDWEAVFRLAEKMAPAARKSEEIALDLDARRAMALAATGRVAQALERLEPWRDAPGQVPGMYWNRLAGVHAMAGDYDRFVACMRQGFAVSEQAVWARIDLALAIARVGEDPSEALELLRDESLAAQPESTQRFIHWARGMALLRLGDYRGAEAALALAVDGFMAQAENPVVWPALALAVGAMAVAGSLNGKQKKARALLAPLREIFDVYADPALAALVKQRVMA